jgi:beta-galactosidase
MDYLGEAGIGASANVSAGGVAYYMPGWPWVNAWCGDIDLIGDQKAPSRYRDVVWGLTKLEMAVQRPIAEGKVEFISQWSWSDELPSWSWAGAESKPLAVRLYTSGDRIELRLNGAPVGEKVLAPADKMRAEIKLPYRPGVLEAIAYTGGREIARKRLETVGAPAQLRLRPERLQAGSGRNRLAFVGIDVLDAQGRLLPDEARRISLSIDGPADLAGFGSGNPLATGSFQSGDAESFRGRALAILRGQGRKGSVRIAARSDGLKGALATLKLV